MSIFNFVKKEIKKITDKFDKEISDFILQKEKEIIAKEKDISAKILNLKNQLIIEEKNAADIAISKANILNMKAIAAVKNQAAT